MADEKLAQQLGCHVQVVTHRRRCLSIAPFRKTCPWTRLEKELLGTMSDKDFARRFKRTVGSVTTCRNKMKILAFVPKSAAARRQLATSTSLAQASFPSQSIRT